MFGFQSNILKASQNSKLCERKMIKRNYPYLSNVTRAKVSYSTIILWSIYYSLMLVNLNKTISHQMAYSSSCIKSCGSMLWGESILHIYNCLQKYIIIIVIFFLQNYKFDPLIVSYFNFNPSFIFRHIIFCLHLRFGRWSLKMKVDCHVLRFNLFLYRYIILKKITFINQMISSSPPTSLVAWCLTR